MSIFQSLNVGIAGLNAQSNALGVISNNLANVNTVGYKRADANFRTLIVNAFSTGSYSPGGAVGGYRQLNGAQGPLTRTDSPTDIGIDGGGFFAVSSTSPASGIVYTRAGAFAPDANGNFRNGAGYYLQGYLLDANGNLPAAVAGASVDAGTAVANLTSINPRSIALLPVATSMATLRTNLRASQAALPHSSVTVQANLNAPQLPLPSSNVSLVGTLNSTQLAYAGTPAYDPTLSSGSMASGAVAPHFTRSMTVIDNAGVEHTVRMGFLKTGADSWAVEVYVQPAGDVTQPDGQLAFGNVTFNPDGTLATASTALTDPINAGWTAGGATNITFNLGTVGAADGLMQAASAYAATATVRPNYDASVETLSMAGGGVAPHFTSTVNVTDNTGVARTLNISFLKTGTNSWSVEIYAVPATDITTAPGGVPGQVASGVATFHSDGSLDTISSSLSNPVPVAWNGSPTANNVTFNWSPATGTSTGLTQLATPFSASLSAAQNYDPTNVNLNMSSGEVDSHFNSEVTVYDPTGAQHTLRIGYLKTGVNTWAVEIYSIPANDVLGANPQVASGILTFNGDGSLASISPSLSAAVPVNWQSGQTNSITFNWGTAGPITGTPGATVVGLTDGLSQLGSAYDSDPAIQDGYSSGLLSSVEITEDGYVVGTYDNEITRRLYKIPLVTFTEPQELTSLNSNVFAYAQGVGTISFLQAKQENAGTIYSNALETSNVDVATELTTMIIAQRAYQSNSKTISTSDEMLRDLTDMVG